MQTMRCLDRMFLLLSFMVDADEENPRLLHHVCREQDIYFLADQNAKQLQIMNLSHEID